MREQNSTENQNKRLYLRRCRRCRFRRGQRRLEVRNLGFKLGLARGECDGRVHELGRTVSTVFGVFVRVGKLLGESRDLQLDGDEQASDVWVSARGGSRGWGMKGAIILMVIMMKIMSMMPMQGRRAVSTNHSHTEKRTKTKTAQRV